jgi:hypothetical protein
MALVSYLSVSDKRIFVLAVSVFCILAVRHACSRVGQSRKFDVSISYQNAMLQFFRYFNPFYYFRKPESMNTIEGHKEDSDIIGGIPIGEEEVDESTTRQDNSKGEVDAGTPPVDQSPEAEEPPQNINFQELQQTIARLARHFDKFVNFTINDRTGRPTVQELYEKLKLHVHTEVQKIVLSLTHLQEQGKQVISKIEPQISALQNKVAELEGTLKFTSEYVQRIEADQVKVLREENEKLKEGITKKFEKRLIDEVIREIDEAEKTVKRLEAKNTGELTVEGCLQATHGTVSDFRTMLQDRFNLTAFWTDANKDVDYDKHRISSKAITNDENLGGKIARTLRCGYKDREGKIFRQEAVVIYEHKKPVDIVENLSITETSVADDSEKNSGSDVEPES